MALSWWGQSFPNWGAFSAQLNKKKIDPRGWAARYPHAARLIGSPFSKAAPVPAASSSTAQPVTAGAPVGSQIIPGIGTYGMHQNQAQLAYEQSIAALNQRQQDIFQQFGFQGNVDPSTGQVSGVQQDPTSVYGILPQLQRQHGTEYEAIKSREASRNIGEGGLAAQSAEDLSYRGGADFARAFAEYRNAIQQTQQGRMEARSDLSASNVGILLDAITQAISNQDFTPADLSSLMTETTATGGGGAPGVRPQGGAGRATGPFQWGGRTMQTKTQMRAFLTSRGASVAAFKKKNPALWARLT